MDGQSKKGKEKVDTTNLCIRTLIIQFLLDDINLRKYLPALSKAS